MACFLGRGVAGQGSGSVRDEQLSCVNHDYSRYHGICRPHRHLTHPRTQRRSTGRARHRLGRRASCQPLPPAELATTAATATAAISSSMTCFTSGPNGAFSVASLIRVLAWRRPERSGATRSRSRQGPASARSTADRGASGPSPAAAARTPPRTESWPGRSRTGWRVGMKTTVLVLAERARRHHPFDQAVPHAADLPVELLDGGLRPLRRRLGTDRGQDLGQEGVGGRIAGRHDPPVLDAEVPGDGQFGEQSARQASVQVRLGAERHGALDGIESDKDELLRDQHDLSVFRTRGRGQIRLSTAATTTALDPAVLFG